jgi:hypothetical protein
MFFYQNIVTGSLMRSFHWSRERKREKKRTNQWVPIISRWEWIRGTRMKLDDDESSGTVTNNVPFRTGVIWLQSISSISPYIDRRAGLSCHSRLLSSLTYSYLLHDNTYLSTRNWFYNWNHSETIRTISHWFSLSVSPCWLTWNAVCSNDWSNDESEWNSVRDETSILSSGELRFKRTHW